MGRPGLRFARSIMRMGMSWLKPLSPIHPFSRTPFFSLPRSLTLPLALSLFLLALFLLAMAGCANPVPPSGGPRDTTPPSIAQSRPENGAVNVERSSVSIVFSEYVERASFAEGLSVTPRFEEPLEFDWSGRAVTVQFPEPLRENTTYILTLDTNVRDVRGVSLDAPLQIAFSTGPTINDGRIAGVVRAAATGQTAEGVDVFAYLLPDTTAARARLNSLPSRPAYRTQTGQDGRFQFDYLREQDYYVIALRDNNRDRRPNAAEAFAPPPQPALRADSSGTEPEAPWIVTALDTIPPRVLRPRSLSAQRLRLQLSEPVRLLDRTAARWSLRDSARQASVAIDAVYQTSDAPSAVFLQTAPQRPAVHRLRIAEGVLADTSGNALQPDTVRFTPAQVAAETTAESADTLRTRFLAFLPENMEPDTLGIYTLWPREQPGVRLNAPLDSAQLQTALAVTDTAGQPLGHAVQSADGTALRLQLDPPLPPGATARLGLRPGAFANLDSLTTRTFRRIGTRQLGTLSGFVRVADAPADRPVDSITVSNANSAVDSLADAASNSITGYTSDSTAAPIVVEVYRTGSSRFAVQRTTADPTGQFSFPDLPEGTFRFRAFLDRNRNGRWDGGQLVPYRPPEPLTWSPGTLDNRPRWDNVLDDTLRVPKLRLPALGS